MAIDAKISFANQLEKRLEAELTVESMAKLMKAVMETLDHFDMREIEWGDEQEKDDLVECYLAALRVSGKSAKTIDRYAYLIGKLQKWCGIPIRRITVYHIREWIAKEKDRGIADSTLEGYRETFTAFFNWLQRESLIDKNPAANLSVIKRRKKKKPILSDVEIEKLLTGCLTSKNPLRDRAIIQFLMTSGCRISEMTGLNRDDVDLNSLEVIVLGKGDTERRVYLSPVAGMALREYLEARTDGNPALFIGKGNRRLQPNGVRVMLNTLAKRVCVEQRVHPHKFRRTLATNLKRRGMQVEEIAAILGHDKLETTMQYVMLDDDDIKQTYRRKYA